MEISEIRTRFEKEFVSIAEKFDFHCLSLDEAYTPNLTPCFPGVYVYWKKGEIWKVGRHLVNPRKRALEHIRDNTRDKMGKYEMADLKGDPDVRILIFITRKASDIHWACALEVFFEANLVPHVRSGRTC